MSLYMEGWIEVKGITSWHGIIKIDSHVFPLLNRQVYRFYEIGEHGRPSDLSEELSENWSQYYQNPAFVLWSKAELVDTQNMEAHEDDWRWKLKEMVEVLKSYYIPDEIRPVFWMM